MKAHNNQVIGNKMNNSKRKIKKSKNKTVKKHDDNKPIVSQSLNLSNMIHLKIRLKNFLKKIR